MRLKKYVVLLITIAISLIIIMCYYWISTKTIDFFTVKNKLSLISQFKNETMNLKVWVDHYIWQGVEKIYLIDNGSTDNPKPILQPYIDNGTVIYHYMPEKHKQREHYQEIVKIENLQEKTEWLIICDLDEFYYGYPNKLANTINEYQEYDIIYSNWYMFGSDGLITHPLDIRKSIVFRNDNYHELTKYIVRPNKITDVSQINIHWVDGIDNKITVNDKIRLNHYPIQSLEFFKNVKMTRGAADGAIHENVRDIDYFNRYDQDKTTKDTLLSDMINN